MATQTMPHVAPPPQESDSKKTMAAFSRWCAAQKMVPNAGLLESWDVRYNASALRKSFGNREDIYTVGLKALYLRWFTNHFRFSVALEGPDGPRTISFQSVRVIDGASEALHLAGVRTKKRVLTELQAKQAAVIERAILRLKLFEMLPEEVLELCADTVERVYKV
jgi:hypothetical protein